MRASAGSPSRFRKRGLLLIVILAVIFSLGGTTYGMAEETLGFYAIILPVIIALGYDRLVGVGTHHGRRRGGHAGVARSTRRAASLPMPPGWPWATGSGCG